MNAMPETDEKDGADEWNRIKDFVGAAKKDKKHPLVQEAERANARQPENYDEGGGPGLTLAPAADQNDIWGGRPPLSPALPPPTSPIVPRGTNQPAIVPPAVPNAQPTSNAAPSPGNYDEQASQILGGLTPQKIAALFDTLNKASNKGQVGAGIAGIGDAIASVGGVHPGNMQATEENLNKNKELALKIPELMATTGKERFGLSQTLQAKDPNSPYSKIVQKSQAPTLQKMGWTPEQIGNVGAEFLNDAVKNGLTYEDTQAKFGLEKEIHKENIGLQEAQLENTKNFQKAQQDIERENQTLGHPLISGAKAIGKGIKNLVSPQTFTPDVTSYAQKHGITEQQAQAIKDKRTGGQ